MALNLRASAVGAAVALALVASACGGAPGVAPMQQQPTRPVGTVATGAAPGALGSLIIASSDLGVGPQRFAFALLDAERRPIADAGVHLRFFKIIREDLAELRAAAEAPFRGQGLEPGLQDRGVYAARVTFDSPGPWGVEALVDRPGRAQESVRARFDVPARSRTPAIGEPVPASKNKTIVDAGSVEELTTARPPDPDLYRTSIAEALAQGRPFLVVFATPAFCTGKTCGPEVEVVQQLKDKHKARMDFIHIEIFNDPAGMLKGGSDRSLRPAVTEWNLPSEPWVFLVDGRGRMFDKFEGFTPAQELEEAVQRLLAAG